MNWKRALIKINIWRADKISDRNFLILSSVIVGIVAGVAAVGLKGSVHFIQQQLKQVLAIEKYGFLFYLFPLAGIVLTVLFVQWVRKGKIGRGIADIIHSISRRSGNIPPDNNYSHLVSSAMTVGFGGSVGLEAPIVVTGSALGSTIARLFLLSQKDKIALLASGAAAGIAAVFNSPVAGVLFAMEVLLADFSIPTFIPVLIAAATGAVISKSLMHEQLFFQLTQDWKMDALPFYVLLGILCGLLSVYFMKMYFWSEKRFASSQSVYRKAVFGGLLLGLLIFIFPPLYGEGYSIIESLLKGEPQNLLQHSLLGHNNNQYLLLLFITGVILVKVFATAVTIGAGGNGGIFAPSLFTGALTGYSLAHFFNSTHIKHLLEVNFIAAGMAGMLSGIVHAPLTAIFLIAEVTGGYALFVPLMIVSAIAYFISKTLEPYSIYTGKLAQKGIRMDDKEAMLLQNINPADIIEPDFVILRKEQKLRNIAELFSAGRQEVFAVINNKELLCGIVFIDDVKQYLFKTEHYDKLSVKGLMTRVIYKVNNDDSMVSIMKKFDASGLWYLPVVDAGQHFLGFADKKKLLGLMRQSMAGL